ncbi:hypothetical protein NW754_013565 [Fusarium falciforme]|uniref:(S)-ureidoglycine aminohydrolase cupin domain-containing protein n=1 Tax=Fusarium falciforme TaxID=195108 RepID=A0A9W8QVM5_9HYPO|nr:hypothetical protein NW754_013565 [Fusarium falciforme]KAJ4177891.1 hypothetical protein NW755_013580 [Fusarium falciforme]
MWTPFDWEDPFHAPQSKGEVVTIRTGGATGGTLAPGLWRMGPGIAGCNDDGTCDIVYSAPSGDETMVLLEGSAEVPATKSGKKYHFKAGDILAHPSTSTSSGTPSGTPPSGTKGDELFFGNIDDNPKDLTPFT